MFSVIWNLFGGNQNSSKQNVASPAAPCPPVNSGKVGTPANPAAGGNWFNGIGKKASATDSVTVYSKAGTPLTLTAQNIKASGGEGLVYELPLSGKEHVLIKLYKDDGLRDARKRDLVFNRLRDMLEMGAIASNRSFAWPKAGVFNANKQLIGFTMNKCAGHSFQAICGGASSVRRYFPHWDRSHLVKTALDFVRKVRFLAAHSVYISDFNPANFLVNENCAVSFIDCDSYQVPKRPSGVHITRTYFPSHVAPELLKDKSLLNEPRQMHHVEFGVAILVFQLLMMGMYPYNYHDPRNKSGCGSQEENLLAGRCPLGTGSGCLLPVGPWYNLWSWLTGSLKGAFIDTFRHGHRAPEKRVSLEQLEAELNKLLYVMNKDDSAMRKQLAPTHPKPRGDKQSTTQADSWKAVA